MSTCFTLHSFKIITHKLRSFNDFLLFLIESKMLKITRIVLKEKTLNSTCSQLCSKIDCLHLCVCLSEGVGVYHLSSVVATSSLLSRHVKLAFPLLVLCGSNWNYYYAITRKFILFRNFFNFSLYKKPKFEV